MTLETFVTIESIVQLHDLLGLSKPKHPLISIIDYAKVRAPRNWVDQKIVSDLYTITLKAPCPEGLLYGRQPFDFDSGTMIFTAPGQVIRLTEDNSEVTFTGWGLCFHPGLIRNTRLSDQIRSYEFFNYQINEALHVSEEEKQTLSWILGNIERELNTGIDRLSQTILVTAIEQLLNYSLRFYDRQFTTRQSQNLDYFSRFEKLVHALLDAEDLSVRGLPGVAFFADQLNLSAGYLSELLKRETGKTAKEIILLALIERAKTTLLNSDMNITEVSYRLGFEHPSYFSRLFKSKTGLTPSAFKNAN